MNRIIVAVFDDRRAVDIARQDLLAAGIHDTQISVEEDASRNGNAHTRVDDVGAQLRPGGTPSPHDGIVDMIARMFSGLLLDDHTIGRYAAALRPCHALVAVHGLDDTAAERAAMILGRHGRIAMTEQAQPARAKLDAGAEREGPRVYPLPNSPTGWDHATRHESAAWLVRR